MALTKEAAKNLSIISVAEQLGMELKRTGSYSYTWTEHDSFVIDARKNDFHWNSRSEFGDVIQLVQTIQGVTYKEAMHFLETGEFKKVDLAAQMASREPFRYSLERYEHPDFKASRSYLRDQRGLSDDTIDFFLSQGSMTEATRKKGDYFEPVIVFKYKDNTGFLAGASLQGVLENRVHYPERGRLKQIMRNSDGQLGFSVDIGKPKRLVFAEAPIDLMSYYELHKDNLQDVRLVAMDGVKEGIISRRFMELYAEMNGKAYQVDQNTGKALETVVNTTDYFKDGQHQDMITLAVDNDAAGQNFITRLQEKGIPVQIAIPPIIQIDQEKEDWNDFLKRGNEATKELVHVYSADEKSWHYQGYFSKEIALAKAQELTADDVKAFVSDRQLTKKEVHQEYTRIINQEKERKHTMSEVHEAGTDFITKLREKKIPVVDARPPKREGQEKTDWNDALRTQDQQSLVDLSAVSVENEKSFNNPLELVWELHRKWEDELAEKIREDLGINHELQAWQFEKEMSRFITTDLDKLFAKRTRLERDAYFADSATSIRKEIDRLDAQILEYIEKAPEQSQEKTDWNHALRTQDQQSLVDLSAVSVENEKSFNNPLELVWELHRKWEDELAEKIREDLGINHELQAWQFEKEMSRFITTDLDKLFAKRTRLERDAYFADSATSIRKEIDRLDAQILEYIEKAPEQSQEKTDWNDALKNQNEKTAENSRLTEGVNQSFDKENFIKGLELMQKYSVEEVLSRPPIYQGDDQRLEALQIDLEGFDYKPLDDFIRQYIDPNYDLDYEEFAVFPDAWNNFFRNGAGKDLTVDSFITLAKNNGLVDEVPVVEPWQALTVLEPIKTYSVKNGDLQEDFDSVSGLLDFVKQKLSETERKILEKELAEVGRGTPTDILMTIDSALVGDFDVYVNGQSIISVYPNNIDEQATVLYVRSSEEAVKDVKKAPEQSQERLIDRTSGGTGSLQLNAEGSPTPVPETSTFEQTVTSHPTSSYPYLHFSTNYDKVQRRVGNYHPITPADLRRLNQYAPSIQSTASWYLSEMAGSKISFVYADHGEENVLQVTFQKENFIHLSGIRPFEEGKGTSDFLEDFAAGRGHYDSMLISNAIKDKLQVLPMLQDILDPQSFVLDDLSSVEKLHNLNMSEAIKAKDEDFLLLFKDTGDEKIPASLMKLKGELATNVKALDEKVILGVYREREGQIEQLSINEAFITDGGKEMMENLQRREFEEINSKEKVIQDNIKQTIPSSDEKIRQHNRKDEMDRDLDGDGISNSDEMLQGTDPYNAASNLHKKQEERVRNTDAEVAAGAIITEAVATKNSERSISQMVADKDTKALAEHLKEGMKNYLDSDQFKSFLDTMSKFHNYSLNNIHLLKMQNPNVTQVASFNKWKTDFERTVKKGAKALKIWVPYQVKTTIPDKQKELTFGQPEKEMDQKEITVTRFKLGNVFDVSQTEGRELPKAVHELTGSVKDYEDLYRAAKAVSTDNQVPISFEEIKRENTNGYYSPNENRIVISKKLKGEEHILKTIFHEMAHADLHKGTNAQYGDDQYRKQELQAESVAYVVASHFGFDTSSYSFGYLAIWAKDKNGFEDMVEQLQVVQKEAKSLIDRMDAKLELVKNKTVVKDKFADKLQQAKEQSEKLTNQKAEAVKQVEEKKSLSSPH